MANEPEPTPKVFISYAWKNQPTAKQMQRDLMRDGVEVFVDYEKISGGDSLPARISAGLDWCNTLLLLWSADAAKSRYVAEEWESAFHLERRIIPCVLDGTALPALLRKKLYLNFLPYDAGYAQLCRSLGVEPKGAASPTPPPPSDGESPPQDVETPAAKEGESHETPLPQPTKRPAVLNNLASKLKRKKPPADQAILIPSEEMGVQPPAPTWWRRSRVTSIALLIIVAAVAVTIYRLCFHPTSASERREPASGVLHLMDKPAELAEVNVKNMLRQYGFYCREHDGSKEWSNPQGEGIANDYEVQQNGEVIFDHKTGLTWQQSGSLEFLTYSMVKIYVDSLNQVNFAGYSNWRLPKLEEAMSLMEPKANASGLHIDPKFGSTQGRIWTSDTYGAGMAWVVFFHDGYCTRSRDDSYGYYVRAVRGGQSG